MYVSRILSSAASVLLLAAGADVALARGRPGPTPPPSSSPPARIFHMLTGNGVADAAGNRLYLYGGDGSDGRALADFWYYKTLSNTWTSVMPSGKSKPGVRKSAGWSCGGGTCVLVDGLRGASLSDETWVYTESTNAWTQVSCTSRTPCPSYREWPVMAYVPGTGRHLLFGGYDDGSFPRPSALYDDTYLFDVATRKWTAQRPAHQPRARWLAAASYVSGIGVVLFGGAATPDGNPSLCDMYVWTGTDWEAVSANNPSPCLEAHSMAWSGTALIVVGGFTDCCTANAVSYRFTFDPGKRSGTWSIASNMTCQDPTGGTDAVIHPYTKMAIDYTEPPTQVFFGGSDASGQTTYGNTVECTGD